MSTRDLEALAVRVEAAERERDEAIQALADYRGQQYAPWGGRDPDDTIGDMIDNQAWVMMSHIASFIGRRDGDPDLMERWQDDWAENYPQLLKGWFSPHRAAAAYIAKQLTIRTPTTGPERMNTRDLEALAGPTAWQPIETAPKDGSLVLLFERPGAMKRRYNLNSSSPKVDGEFFVGRFNPHWKSWLSAPGEYQRKPTHWTPLPPPPDPSA